MLSSKVSDGQCKLCGIQGELQLSHIIPAFVFRWLRDTSGGGHIRFGTAPNRRVQDGLKLYWLCNACEARLNRSETLFANRVFYPYLNDARARIPYGRWLNEFAVSLSWRILRFYRDEEGLDGWDEEAKLYVDAAEQTWREVLLGVRPHPGPHEQHLLPVDIIESAGSLRPSLAPNINRYLTRAIDMDLCRGNRNIFTYAKLGRFLFIGFVREPELRQWRGSKVHASRGLLEPRRYVVPAALGDFLNDKSNRMSQLLEGMSPAQHRKVDVAFRRNAERFVQSDAFRAMQADVEMFGDAAFSKERRTDDE